MDIVYAYTTYNSSLFVKSHVKALKGKCRCVIRANDMSVETNRRGGRGDDCLSAKCRAQQLEVRDAAL